jgi:hypothetical protein
MAKAEQRWSSPLVAATITSSSAAMPSRSRPRRINVYAVRHPIHPRTVAGLHL